MKKKTKKIKYGTVEIPEGFDDPKNLKVRVTFWMDGDLLLELRKRSAEEGVGYQTYMHKVLRDTLMERPPRTKGAKAESRIKKHV